MHCSYTNEHIDEPWYRDAIIKELDHLHVAGFVLGRSLHSEDDILIRYTSQDDIGVQFLNFQAAKHGLVGSEKRREELSDREDLYR